MALSNICLFFCLAFSVCSIGLCHDFLEANCHKPTTKETFDLVARNSWIQSHFICIYGEKIVISCSRSVLNKINGFGEAYVEYVLDNTHHHYNKTLIHNADGTVTENRGGRLSPYHFISFPNGLLIAVNCLPEDTHVHIGYLQNGPDLRAESRNLASYLTEDPDIFITDQRNCNYEDLRAMEKRHTKESNKNCEL